MAISNSLKHKICFEIEGKLVLKSVGTDKNKRRGMEQIKLNIQSLCIMKFWSKDCLTPTAILMCLESYVRVDDLFYK